MRRTVLAILALAALAAAAPPARALAGQVLDFTVSGDTATAELSLPVGLGADLSVSFEQVSNLDQQSLGLSVQSVSLLDLLGRLPQGVTLATAFPLLLRITPPADGALSFQGVATVDLHTTNLLYVVGTPLRLFKAEDGGSFHDVTVSMGSGSYRVRGTTGGFSEFLILVDLRPTATVIGAKYDRLQQLLDADRTSVPSAVADALASELQASLAAYQVGDLIGARGQLEQLAATVVAHSGTDIPDVWSAARDRVDMAGDLRAAASTLELSLALAAGS